MENTPMDRESRDLLIELRTKVENMATDVKELKDNTVSRLSSVEQSKLDRTEAVRLQNDQFGINTDFEKRLRVIERYMWGAIATLTAIMFGLNYFK